MLKAEGDATGIPNEMIHLSLTKVDYDTKAPLAGVTFTLKPAEDSTFLGTSQEPVPLTTDADGKVSIPRGLVQQKNSYILTETGLGTNSSYRLADDEADRRITFLVNEDGTMAITSENAMLAMAAGDATALVVQNQQISLTVAKRDQATGESLSGVKLKLSKLEGAEWAAVEWTTDGNGKRFKDANFTPGTYRLEETETPEGYNAIAAPLTFTITQSGKITDAKVGAEEWTASAKTNFTIDNPADGQPGGITLTVDNAAYSDLRITKQGSDHVPLSGVIFRLDYREGDVWKCVKLENGKAVITNKTLTEGTADEAKLTTGGDGVATFSGLPNGRYRLTELQTVQGYNLLSTPLEIEIDRNGEGYTVTGGGTTSDLTRQENTILLTVINQKGLVLPATGTTTPQLPKPVLGLTALLEGLMLYAYWLSGKRRKREAKCRQ